MNEHFYWCYFYGYFIYKKCKINTCKKCESVHLTLCKYKWNNQSLYYCTVYAFASK